MRPLAHQGLDEGGARGLRRRLRKMHEVGGDGGLGEAPEGPRKHRAVGVVLAERNPQRVAGIHAALGEGLEGLVGGGGVLGVPPEDDLDEGVDELRRHREGRHREAAGVRQRRGEHRLPPREGQRREGLAGVRQVVAVGQVELVGKQLVNPRVGLCAALPRETRHRHAQRGPQAPDAVRAVAVVVQGAAQLVPEGRHRRGHERVEPRGGLCRIAREGRIEEHTGTRAVVVVVALGEVVERREEPCDAAIPQRLPQACEAHGLDARGHEGLGHRAPPRVVPEARARLGVQRLVVCVGDKTLRGARDKGRGKGPVAPGVGVEELRHARGLGLWRQRVDRRTELVGAGPHEGLDEGLHRPEGAPEAPHRGVLAGCLRVQLGQHREGRAHAVEGLRVDAVPELVPPRRAPREVERPRGEGLPERAAAEHVVTAKHLAQRVEVAPRVGPGPHNGLHLLNHFLRRHRGGPGSVVVASCGAAPASGVGAVRVAASAAPASGVGVAPPASGGSRRALRASSALCWA